ncbi:MAG: phosphatase PAP2 family protein [Campylobacterales bacterium]
MLWGISYRFLFFALLAGVLFFLFPGIDLWVASLFYDPASGFFLANHPIVTTIWRWAPRLIAFAGFLALIIWLALLASQKTVLWGVPRWGFLFLVVALLLGPGLIVNVILKESMGRARPVQIQEFGGQAHFTPALVKASECQHNCSFVSGHAAGAFAFFLPWFLLRGRRTGVVVLWAGVVWGSIVGLVRMMQGGHFLSDIYWAFVIVYLTGGWLWYFMSPHQISEPSQTLPKNRKSKKR